MASASQLRATVLPSRYWEIIPGLVVAFAIALAATLVGRASSLPAVLIALLIGLGIGNFAPNARIAPGAGFAAKPLLRVAIVLLGARVTVSEIVALGPAVGILTVASLIVALGAGIFLTRWLKLDLGQGLVFSSATAICGASAALAVTAALPDDKRRESDAAAAIAGVTIAGSLAMALYPMVAHFLSLSGKSAGVLMGTTLHEVVQAVGAGYSISMEAGDAATATKLLRVACLAPVTLIVSRIVCGRKAAPLPWFVWGFLLVASLASALPIPKLFITAASEASQWMLLAAVAALGLRTPVSLLRSIGLRPLSLMILQSFVLFGFALVGVMLWVR